MRSSIRLTLTLLIVPLALAGCEDPYQRDAERERTATAPVQTTPAAETTPTATVPPPADELATVPAQAEVEDPGASPTAVLEEFGRRWSNWDWRDVANQRGRLTPLSTGRLRAELDAQSEEPLDTDTLERTRPGFKGRVEGVVLKPRKGDTRPALVIVRQQEYVDGTPKPGGKTYTVYLAEVTEVRGGWAVSAWEGQQ